MLSEEFTKNQLSEISAQREHSWGHQVVNGDCMESWRMLSYRLGMTPEKHANVKTLRSWMETSGPVLSTGRGVTRESQPGPSRIRRYEEMDGRSRPTERSVRGRYDDSRSRSRSRSNTGLRRGESGRSLYRTRDDN